MSASPPTQPTSAAHPVAQLLAERAASGSQPGARADDASIALVIEGGGMRGAVATGMVAGLEGLGLGDAFDSVYGTSSGAIAGAAFLARQTATGARAYYEDLVDGPFINYRRALRGGPLVSLDYLFNWVIPNVRRFELRRCLDSVIPFTVVATRLGADGECTPDYLTGFTDEDDLLSALRASCTIPLACGPPMAIRGGTYVDGALTESIPVRAAFGAGGSGERPTHALVLLTRPEGELRRPPNLLERRLLYPLMNRKTTGLGSAHLRQSDDYAAEMRAISAMDNALVISRAASAVKVGRLEQDPSVIARGAIEGAAAVHHGLTGRMPALSGALIGA
ncbi:MAG TPA: patatin-like phospholipase family protein [Conexibacter sp.]